MIYLCLALGLILIITFVFFIDYGWFYRIEQSINRKYLQEKIDDDKKWEQLLLKRNILWLKKTPTVPSRDSAKSNLFDLIKKSNKQNSIQVWQVGSLYLSLKEYNKKKNDLKIEKALKDFENNDLRKYNFNNIQDADYGLMCYALLENGKEQYNNLMLQYIKKNILHNEIIAYKHNVRNNAFVDTLGFVCPFLVKYGLITGDRSYIELAKKQLDTYFNNGVERATLLPFHAYSLDENVPRGICDWARGLAWLLIALMDSYKCLKDNNDEDNFILQKIQYYADALVKMQRYDGGFSWMLLEKKNTDSSATAVFGWFLACAFKYVKNETYKRGAVKSREFLMRITNIKGVIDYCQGDTLGIGMYSRIFDKMPFAQGFALRLQMELEYGE